MPGMRGLQARGLSRASGWRWTRSRSTESCCSWRPFTWAGIPQTSPRITWVRAEELVRSWHLRSPVGQGLILRHPLCLADALEAAASSLGLRALEEFCAAKRGALAERVRDWRWEEVVAGNDAGGCLLAVDGMVLDVKRWLPEHPGGDRIIPAQALNVDSTGERTLAKHRSGPCGSPSDTQVMCTLPSPPPTAVFFELYHVTRESFLLLKEFYVGEVVPEDL